jgi:hypothetical protein
MRRQQVVLHAGIETRQVFVLEACPYLADALVLVLLDIVAGLTTHFNHSFIPFMGAMDNRCCNLQ